MSAPDQLLVVIDPVARRSDGESVRIAKDVLCGGAAAKVCLPDTPEEFARALARRGGRRPVVVGDDRALVRAVGLLHGSDRAELSLVPVGPEETVRLASALGAPLGPVSAARTALGGVRRRMDLLVDEDGGVVVGELRVPEGGRAAVPAPSTVRGWGTARSLVRTLVGPPPGAARVPQMRGHRLRVEVDGRLLGDDLVDGVTVAAHDGTARVELRPRASRPVRYAARRTVTISCTAGPGFHYRADTLVGGPVASRTWTVRPSSWSLVLPPGA
ncbi:diacylglycerol kinase [Streptomyces sp. MUM 203J]|uniref:diacylglycerol kinase n=1 Tax=Streptomyces sp. MUM 203J TaxID=2791990 RepID=UPI001F03D0D1|nr:diacylglycerol kinase [Streptomyces sp. MUM 203J]MCH0539816.1 diacylglycerol kinase [Streptomyces sp. MUM 203J]